MFLRSWRFLTVILTALALTMSSAHMLELPAKMGYDAGLYTAVNNTLYTEFGVVGRIYMSGSIIAVAVLLILVRRRRGAFRWTLAATAALALGLVSRLVLVAPVNEEITNAVQHAPGTVPVLWMALRDRWEYGHATGFILQLVGLSALVVSLLVEIPRHRSRRIVA